MIRVGVLDRGYVELVSQMGDDYTIVAEASRTTGRKMKGNRVDRAFLISLLKRGHTSPFELVEFKFNVHAPVVVWWQWVRHRTWSYLGRSGRYTKFSPDMLYTPEWHKQSGVAIKDADLDRKLVDHYTQSFALYETAISRGVAKEQARLFLPGFAMYYTFTAKVDGNNLIKFLQQRMAKGAQWEIRQYANALYGILQEVMPWTAAAFAELDDVS